MMRRVMPFVLTAVFLACALLVPGITLAATPSYDQAIDQLFQAGYPQKLMAYLTSQGTSEQGWSLGGTTADAKRAEYLAGELRSMGYRVDLEQVPLDVLTFHGASLIVAGRTLPASTFGGVRATPPGGITGQVVYAGRGFVSGYAGLGDVTGKLVLIDEATVPLWQPLPWFEAELRGAAGIIFCGWPGDSPSFVDQYYADPDSIGQLPGWYLYSSIPVVYVSINSGLALKTQLAQGPVTATLVNDVEYTFASAKGKGYNLVATIPGARGHDTRTIVSAHRDAYWRAAVDDTAGCISAVVMAKAMQLSGYKPDHDVVILLTTGEEWGAVDTLFDYGIGAWYAITRSHPNWAGSTTAFIGLDGPGMRDTLQIRANPEIARVLGEIAKVNTPTLLPGWQNLPLGSSTDNWTFSSAGVPTLNFRERTGRYYSNWYHTNLDTSEQIDWEAFAKFEKFLNQVVRRFDGGLLPYNLADRAEEVAARINTDELKSVGADPAAVDRLAAAIAEFRSQAEAYQARAAGISNTDAVNKKLMQIVKKIGSDWTAFAADGQVLYPHEQVFKDSSGIKAALFALQDPVDATTAKNQLATVAMTGYGLNFSPEAYSKILALHQPWSPNLPWNVDWDSLTHMAPIPDVRPAYDLISGGRYSEAREILVPMLDGEIAVLNGRLYGMWRTLQTVNGELASLQ